MITFLYRYRDRNVTIPCVPPAFEWLAVPSVPKRSLVYCRFQAFLNVFKPQIDKKPSLKDEFFHNVQSLKRISFDFFNFLMLPYSNV